MEEPWSTMARREIWASSEHLFPEARTQRFKEQKAKGTGVGIHLLIESDNRRQVPLRNDRCYGRAKVKKTSGKAGKIN